MATSQNGWPALSSASSLLYSWNVPGPSRTKIKLRNGSGGFLLIHWATFFDSQIEDLDEPQLDDWGYAYRPIRGFESGLSNHSSGTAMDLNATDHPLGKSDTFTNSEEEKIHKVLSKYVGCVRWGGDYNGRKDEMHYELDRNIAECERVARKLMHTKRGELVLNANPSQRRVIMS